jgi:spermidine synthase
MKKWTHLEELTLPGDVKVGLYSHDQDYAIRVNGRELMSSRHHASEVELAIVACESLCHRQGIKVLIGGLGLGFTLRAALAHLGPDASVVVSELLPEIVGWHQNPDYKLAAVELADSRTSVEICDVADRIAASKNEFDAIMLDADNETTDMNTPGNRSLYQKAGLSQVFAALKSKSVCVYWSAQADPDLVKNMGKVGFTVESRKMPRGSHVLVVGRKGSKS